MNSDNKTDFQKYVEESEKERVLQQEKTIQDYINGDEEFKKDAWSSYIFKLLQNHRFLSSTHEPELIDFTEFRKENLYSEVENDIDKFLPGILKDLQDFYGDEGNPLEIIFILDEQAKKAIEIQSNISNNSEQVENTISSKTEKIEGINISNEELAEKVGDLFYDSLSSFISSLGNEIDNKEISTLLEKASKHILTAWEICLPYVSNDFPEMKHTTEIKGINIDKAELVNRIGNLETNILADFLEKLSLKIQKDGEVDKGRGRIKLANELFACADKLEVASKII